MCIWDASTMLEVKDINLLYGAAQALRGVSISAEPGKVTVHAPNLEEDWHVTLAETGLNAMTGCRVKRIEQYISGEHFMLTYGDGVADIDIRALVDFHHSHGLTATVTAVRPPGRFGEIEIDGHQVT